MSGEFKHLEIGTVLRTVPRVLVPFFAAQELYDVQQRPISSEAGPIHTRDIVLMMAGEYARIGLLAYGLQHPDLTKIVFVGFSYALIGCVARFWAQNIVWDTVTGSSD